MAEQLFAAAVREGPDAYFSFYESGMFAAFDEAFKTDPEVLVPVIVHLCADEILLAYALARLADKNYVFRSSFKPIFQQLMSTELRPTLVHEAIMAALHRQQWLALRLVIRAARTRESRTLILDTCIELNVSPDIIHLIAGYLKETNARAIQISSPGDILSVEHIFAMENWMLWRAQDRCDITNEQWITNGHYRRAVGRLYTIVGCYVEGLVTTQNRLFLDFLQLMKRLPIDVQQVVANRVYGCNRDIVPRTDDDESVYWVLQLGPKYEPL
jgi:hypothetical protein